MPLQFGSTSVSKLMLGTSQVALTYFGTGNVGGAANKLIGVLAGQSLAEYIDIRGTPRVVIEYAKKIRALMGYPQTGTMQRFGGSPSITADSTTRTGSDFSVRIINGASGGSALLDVSDPAQVTAGNYWWNTQANPTSPFYPAQDNAANTPGPLLRALVTIIQTYGIDFLHWSQAQTDSGYVDASSGNETTYKNGLLSLISTVRTAAGKPSLPIMIARIGRGNVYGESALEKISVIQTDIALTGTNIFIAADEYIGAYALGPTIASCSFSAGGTVISTVNTTGITANMELVGTGIDVGTYVQSVQAGVSITVTKPLLSNQSNITINRMDGVHLYPGSDGVQPLDSNGNTTHDTSKGFYALCNRMASSISRWFLSSTSRRFFGPSVTAMAATVGNSYLDLTVTHDQGTALTTLSGSVSADTVRQFRVTLDGTPLTVSSVAITGATTIRLNLSAPLVAGDLKVTIAYGAMNKTNNLSFIVDNASEPTPLQRQSPTLFPALATTLTGVVSRTDMQTAGFSNMLAQWDFTLSASYPGTGTALANLINSPADGSAKTAYDLTMTGLTFNGTAGSAAAYAATAGAGYAELPTNTAAVNNFGKTTGGQNYTIVMVYEPVDTSTSSYLYSTQNTTSTVGYAASNGASVTHRQRGDAANANVTPTGTTSAGTPTILITTHNHSTGKSRGWLNTRTATELDHVFDTTTTNPSMNLHFFSRNDSTAYMANGSKLIGMAQLNTYIDNTQAGAIIDYYNTLHGRTYA